MSVPSTAAAPRTSADAWLELSAKELPPNVRSWPGEKRLLLDVRDAEGLRLRQNGSLPYCPH